MWGCRGRHLDSFLYEGKGCVRLPATHMQDRRVVQQLRWDGLQPVGLLLLCSILQHTWYM